MYVKVSFKSKSQHSLGNALRYGDGVEKNETESFKWIFEASKANQKESIYSVGLAYDNGFGVSVDKGKAFTYYKKAAELGYVCKRTV